MDMSDAYANAKYIPDAASYPPRWTAQAEAFRVGMLESGRADIDVPYADHARAKLDVFRPESTSKGLFVFVHGGYWRAFDKAVWSHFAKGAVDQGWTVVMPSYPLAPEIGISDITQFVKQAIEHAAKQVDGPIVLAGHSAGGHLVARMLCHDGLSEEVSARILRVVPISPLSDLRPLVDADLNEDLRLSLTEAEAESPVLLEKDVRVPVIVWVGGSERPAFLDQAKWLAEAWPETSCIVDEERHHFDVIDGLEHFDSPLLKAILG